MPNQTSNDIKYFCDPFTIPIKLKADDQITAQCNSENNRKTCLKTQLDEPRNNSRVRWIETKMMRLQWTCAHQNQTIEEARKHCLV